MSWRYTQHYYNNLIHTSLTVLRHLLLCLLPLKENITSVCTFRSVTLTTYWNTSQSTRSTGAIICATRVFSGRLTITSDDIQYLALQVHQSWLVHIFHFLPSRPSPQVLNYDHPIIEFGERLVRSGNRQLCSLVVTQWDKFSTYGEIVQKYLSYLRSRYGICSVVFDGYLDGPSTKDHKHFRRKKKA